MGLSGVCLNGFHRMSWILFSHVQGPGYRVGRRGGIDYSNSVTNPGQVIEARRIGLATGRPRWRRRDDASSVRLVLIERLFNNLSVLVDGREPGLALANIHFGRSRNNSAIPFGQKDRQSKTASVMETLSRPFLLVIVLVFRPATARFRGIWSLRRQWGQRSCIPRMTA